MTTGSPITDKLGNELKPQTNVGSVAIVDTFPPSFWYSRHVHGDESKIGGRHGIPAKVVISGNWLDAGRIEYDSIQPGNLMARRQEDNALFALPLEKPPVLVWEDRSVASSYEFGPTFLLFSEIDEGHYVVESCVPAVRDESRNETVPGVPVVSITVDVSPPELTLEAGQLTASKLRFGNIQDDHRIEIGPPQAGIEMIDLV